MKKRTRQSPKRKQREGESAFYRRVHRLVSRLVLWLFRVRVHYAEREPDEEHYLLCCNHISAVDPVILLAALSKQQTHFMAKKELFHIPLLGTLLRALCAFPVDRSGDVGAIKTTVGLLTSGQCVGVFPQGTRCPGREPRETLPNIKNGVGLLCEKTHVTVLPACLRVHKNRLRLFCGVDLVFGQPMPYEQYAAEQAEGQEAATNSHQAKYSRIAHAVFERICELYEMPIPENEKE